MPCLDVTYPAGAIDEPTRKELAEKLTTTFMHWEGAPATDFFRQQCWVYFQVGRRDVFFQMFDGTGAGNRQHVGGLLQQPYQR